MTRNELVALVTKIVECTGTEEEVDSWIDLFKANVPHPSPTDLIFHSSEELTPEQIVDKALSYRPIQL